MYRIFIVEDDSVIAGVMQNHLACWGYTVQLAQHFEHLINEFAAFDPHLVLLDLSLPFFNGYHWCTEIRKLSKVPIVFISSASDNINIVMSIQMGGDDFLSKPFDLSVLTAKVQAILRRTYDFGGTAPLLECHGAVLNLADSSLSVSGQRVDLTKNEFKILKLLFENQGRIVERVTIMNRLWESDSFVDENTLTVNVNRLRKKLEQAGLYGLIHTQKGVGYIIR